MSELKKYFENKNEAYFYKDKTFSGTDDEYKELLAKSTTLYVGQVNVSVTEERLWELFLIVGKVKRIIMGINKNDFTPCGFCFVEYYSRFDAEQAIQLLNGFRLDNLCLKIDFDYGFAEGREFGRGQKGGQIRDDYKRVKKEYVRYYN